jgi:glycosyltransferase involved in cell wall biosynthesis
MVVMLEGGRRLPDDDCSKLPRSMRRARVALVVPALEEGGGVPVVALFLQRILEESGRYEPRFVSVAMSSRDADSRRLVSPASWGGPRVRDGEWNGRTFRHVGAVFPEFEFQRYKPRPLLTRELDACDLVQVVSGSPNWALVASESRRPVLLQVATLAEVERVELLRTGPLPLRLWRGWMTRALARMDETALQHVDAAFVENQWMYDHLRERMDHDRVIFAPPGVDTDRFHPAQTPATESGHILCVGRFADPRKRIALLFEAYALLRERFPEAPTLILAGATGPTEPDWARAEELGVREAVDFRERVPEEELLELYRTASLFALSSDEEGLGLVILEAMASAIPVVSTACGGPATSVVDGETGWLVPRGDAEALAAAMAKTLGDRELLQRMGREARRRAVESFSIAATGRLFLERYDRLLSA